MENPPSYYGIQHCDVTASHAVSMAITFLLYKYSARKKSMVVFTYSFNPVCVWWWGEGGGAETKWCCWNFKWIRKWSGYNRGIESSGLQPLFPWLPFFPFSSRGFLPCWRFYIFEFGSFWLYTCTHFEGSEIKTTQHSDRHQWETRDRECTEICLFW